MSCMLCSDVVCYCNIVLTHSTSYKASPASVRKVGSHSKRQLLRRQHSGDKPKKQRSSHSKVANEDSGILLSTEDWEENESSSGGGDSQTVGVA